VNLPERLKILLIRGGGIGDIILTIPALISLKKLMPKCEITILSPWSVDDDSSPIQLLYELDLIDNHISIPFINKPGLKNYLQLLKIVYSNRNKYQISICLRHSLRNLISRSLDYLFFRVLLNTRAGIGFWNASELSHLQLSENDTIPMVQEYKRLMYILGSEGLEVNTAETMMPNISDILSKIKKFDVKINSVDISKKYVIICPFGRDNKKKWSLQNYIELSKILINNGLYIYIIGSEEERKIGNQIVKSIGKNSFNLCGKFTLIESVKLFERCALYIGNDTGPMHIAGLLNKPLVALFSKHSNPGKFYPMGDNNYIIRNEGDSIDNINISAVLKGINKFLKVKYE
tara:strand:- start:1016 stop:2056 length:1041 start_codon:yes stop_codon:yes gene_type:complete